ncbi:biotin--[acetyl-CoA-carboxylase] ligase [Propionicicella superfundia]|uniref:biotin--[acetyl-CoA-carboxylase] ligase n=1 Tax=Propionicicella superfundia TaxID=348582 RepID=UPI000404844B|nr:biotin--[acetyl-CoA-carboxylase] ligase [Propionicicella superfundia]
MPESPPLDVRQVRTRVADTRWGPVEWVAGTGSTNADIAAAARAGARPGRVRIAEHQESGRGRLGRHWSSPAGACLAMSMLTRPVVPTPAWTWMPLLAGMAVADALRTLQVDDVAVKWPNDVLVGGGKICGILADLVAAPEGPAVVLGIGVNMTLSADELPVPTATSLLLQGADVSKTDLAVAVLRELDEQLTRLDRGADLAAAFTATCATIGRDVRVEVLESEPVLGTACGVDAQGRLGVRTAEGVTWFAAGDVFHLR